MRWKGADFRNVQVKAKEVVSVRGKKWALLVIDMQKCFTDPCGANYYPGAADMWKGEALPLPDLTQCRLAIMTVGAPHHNEGISKLEANLLNVI